jgi:hypothetical protein
LILIGDKKVATTTIGPSPAAPTIVATLGTDATTAAIVLYNPLAAVTTTYTAPGNSAEAVSPAAFSLVEGGVKVGYTVVLDRPPSHDVTVALGHTTALLPVPNSLTFTAVNWNTPQQVLVAAAANDLLQGEHMASIVKTCTSDDAAFQSGTGTSKLQVPNVTVTVSDNQLEKLFWTDRGADTINRANLGGNGQEVLATTDSPYPMGVGVEVLQQKLYWVDKVSGINHGRLF